MRPIPILAILLCLVSGADADRRRALMMKRTVVAADGPNVWYDIQNPASDDTLGVFSATEYNGAIVTVGQAGTATKGRIRVNNFGAAQHNIGVALYPAAGGAVMASGTATVETTDDDVWIECTFGSPVAVSATTYYLVITADSADVGYYYLAGSGSMGIYSYAGFGSFPETPLGSIIGPFARNITAGLYVD